MWPGFDESLKRYRELEAAMSDPATMADAGRYSKLIREHGQLAKQARPYQDYLHLDEQIKPENYGYKYHRVEGIEWFFEEPPL